MAVPTIISDMSVTPSLNSPQGTESAKGTIDDYLRAHAAFIRQTSDLVLGATVTLPSASTVAIGFAASSNIAITGTTTISSFDTYAEGALRYVTFSGAMTLVYSAAMALPTTANITTVSGDSGLFKSLGGGNWKCLIYQRLSGLTLTQASASANGYLTAADWNTFNAATTALALKAPLASPHFTGSVGIGTTTPGSALSFGATFGVNTLSGVPTLRMYEDATYSYGIAAGANGLELSSNYNLADMRFFTGGTTAAPLERMRLVANGNLLIGTATDNGTNKVQVSGSISATSYTGSGGNLTGFTSGQITTALGFTPQTALGFTPYNSTNPAGYIASITSGSVTTALGFTPANAAGQAFTGNISAPVVTQTSDERKKCNWRPLTDEQLEALANMERAGLFDWNDGGTSLGGSAQEIARIVPQAVHEDERGDLTVNYGGLCFAVQQATLRRLWGKK